MPWLRLVRVCRIAGSPVWLGLVAVVALAWWFAMTWTLPSNSNVQSDAAIRLLGKLPGDWILPPELAPAETWNAKPASNAPSSNSPVASIVTLIFATPTWMALARLGGLLTAGRDMPDVGHTLRWTWRRLHRGYIAVGLPIACSLPCLAWIALIRTAVSWTQHPWLAWLTAPLTLVAALIIGLLLLAAKTAVPLSLAALATEPDPDPIDALSRGYEYTLRRLPQLCLYVLVAIALTTIVATAWTLIGYWSAWAATPLLRELGDAGVGFRTAKIFGGVVIATMMASMSGGIYLLLRESAGGQEVEDVAATPTPEPVRVPPLSKDNTNDQTKRSTAGSP
ncbi:MAG: hypothetical protein AAGJ40_17770 [Planctomycetota bacterium]